MNAEDQLEYDDSEVESEEPATILEEKPEPEEKPDKPEESLFSPEQQAVFDREMGRKTAKIREMERQAEDERRQREEIEAKLQQMQAPTRPDVPPMPDPFDDDFDDKVKARDEAMANLYRYEAEQQSLRNQQEYLARQEQERVITNLRNTVAEYSSRADRLGIKAEELQVAGNTVAQFGMDPGVIEYILTDEQGPALTMYLSEHLMELEKLREMNPTRAAIYLETQVKGKASRGRQRTPSAPAPTDRPGGAPPPQDDVPGVVYE